MLPIGVIGLGKLGKIHARIYKELPGIRLSGFCDKSPQVLKEAKDKLKLEIFSTRDYKKLLGLGIKAVSIASDTSSHYKIAKFFLKHRVHCLVEKPLVTKVNQAEELLRLARKNKTILMVGLVERFNSAFTAIRKIAKNPKFIECHRLTPFPERSLDISVVLDLMIHDLDIILHIVKAKPVKYESVGVKVLSQNLDIANARLTFKNGCIANITSSRISREQTRKLRIFLPSAYISLNYAKQEVEIFTKKANQIDQVKIPVLKEEPLKKEIQQFIKNIKKAPKDYTPAHDAVSALKLALNIEKNAKSR